MPDPTPEPELDRRLTLGEHLEELRTRVIRGLYAFGLALVVCLFFQDPLTYIAVWPQLRTMEAIEKASPGRNVEIITVGPTEGFGAYLSVSMISALFLSAPFLLYQLWLFIRAGLYRQERRYVTQYVPLTLGLFVLGVLFGYFVLIPTALRFLVAYGGDFVSPKVSLKEYLSFFFLLTFAVGISFELPLFMIFFGKIGVVNAARYRQARPYAVLLAFIVGAIFTPPDPVSQTLLAVPLYALFEVGIVLCRRAELAAAAAAGRSDSGSTASQ